MSLPRLVHIILHPLTPTRRLAILDPATNEILASFESVPGTDPTIRVGDAKDFCRQSHWRFTTRLPRGKDAD